MTRVELTIKTTYLPSWGAYDGIRELIQNGRDAELEHGAPLRVTHDPDRSALVIDNEGATLTHEALLFGHTTKQGRAELLGKFGEGLKIGMLALVRAGHAVTVHTGTETWRPAIEPSTSFNADVLAIHIESSGRTEKRVRVEVEGVQAAEWAVMRTCFLFLAEGPANVESRIDTDHGALLLGEQDTGKVYVKGIFVERDPKLRFGYDLTHDVDLDRDRKMIARWDLEWRMRLIWQESCARRKDLIARFYDALEQNAADVGGVNKASAGYLPSAVGVYAAQAFAARHGGDAVPVQTIAESRDVEHMGKRGVLVNESLGAVLQTVFGTTEQLKARLANEAVRLYGWGELSAAEKSSLQDAIAIVARVEPVALEDIDIADFRSSDTLGMFQAGHVLLSKTHLACPNTTLATLVHEVAHRAGGDGHHNHVAAIERIWGGIVAGYRGTVDAQPAREAPQPTPAPAITAEPEAATDLDIPF